MTYTICEPCIDVKDRTCVDECPVDCIYEGGRMLYIQPDESVALQAVAPQAQQYASIPHYRWQFEAMGLGEEAARASSGEDTDGLTWAVALVGDPAAAAARLQAYREAGADLPVVYPVPALEPVSSILGTVMALAPRPIVA